jgi:hypothetical protein
MSGPGYYVTFTGSELRVAEQEFFDEFAELLAAALLRLTKKGTRRIALKTMRRLCLAASSDCLDDIPGVAWRLVAAELGAVRLERVERPRRRSPRTADNNQPTDTFYLLHY